MSRSFFWVDGSRKKKLSCMHLSTSWKISPRSASSCRRQAHGDFQSFVRCQTRRAFCLEMDCIHCHRPLADRWKILDHLGSRYIVGSGLAETSMRFLNPRASLTRMIDLMDRKEGMPVRDSKTLIPMTADGRSDLPAYRSQPILTRIESVRVSDGLSKISTVWCHDLPAFASGMSANECPKQPGVHAEHPPGAS